MTEYTQQELDLIAEAPIFIGMAVALVDMGIISTAIETVALSQQLANVAKQYPVNSIIQSVFSETALKSGHIKSKKPDIKPEDVKSGVVVDHAIAAANKALAVVEGNATADEIVQYKDFLYTCADAVANAAGSGLFGTGSEKVSDKEAVALAKIKAALMM